MVLFKMLTRRMVQTALLVCAVFTVSHSPTAKASSLVFTGQNAALFNTANPNDTSLLMNSVNKSRAADIISAEEPIAKMIQNAVVSQISSKIYDDIFGANPKAGGTYDLGGGNIVEFHRSGGYVYISIITPTGTTQIKIPDA
jgi:hypothetical protein